MDTIDIYQGKGKKFTVTYTDGELSLSEFTNVLATFRSGGKVFAAYSLTELDGFETGSIDATDIYEGTVVIYLGPDKTKNATPGQYTVDLKFTDNNYPEEVSFSPGSILVHSLAKK